MFAIVTDSTAYISQSQAKEWNVHIVGMVYSDGKASYLEQFSDKNGAFEKVIGTGKWATAQPAIGAYKAKFEELAGQYGQVLCLIISSRLSGAYNSALNAAKEVGGDKVVVVDSLATAGALKLQVRRAFELNRQGLSARDAAAVLESERGDVRCIFSVDDMEPLRRSGRIGVVRQAIGTILNIRPVLMLKEGAIVTSQMSKGRHDQIEKLIGSVSGRVTEIDVAYFGSPESAVQLMSGLTEKFPSVKVAVSAIGPVLGIHLGLTAIGVAYRVHSET